MRLSLEQRAMILDEYRSGVPLNKLAARHGIHLSTPGWLAKQHGIPPRERGGWNRGKRREREA